MVDPWGTVIGECSDENNIAVAEIDLELLRRTRLSMPVFEHRRHDVYPALLPKNHLTPASKDQESEIYQFGQVSVKSRGVFTKTENSIAFTNKKCVVPGRILSVENHKFEVS